MERSRFGNLLKKENNSVKKIYKNKRFGNSVTEKKNSVLVTDLWKDIENVTF
jgi:hypothetical protein